MRNKKEEKHLNKEWESLESLKEELHLRLFITGATPNSVRAITNIKQICEENFKGKYRLEIIDVYQQRAIAENEQLIALPLLIRKQPSPERRMIGDLSDTQKVLKLLGTLS
jgi:circadian clock protein KaiB